MTLKNKLRHWRTVLDQHLPHPKEKTPLSDAHLIVSGDVYLIRGTGGIANALHAIEEDVVQSLRAHFPEQAWPIRLTYGLGFKNALVLKEIRIAGIILNGTKSHLPIERRKISLTSRDTSLEGLAALAEEFALLAQLCPSSNRPVQCWSTGNAITGKPYLSHSGVYAKTEIEALLKIEWERRGKTALSDILQRGALPRGHNDDRVWFVGTELTDLDINPEGRPLMRSDVAQQLEEYLAYQALA